MAGRSRTETFARLFETVHEGVYIASLACRAGDRDETFAVNPHLRLIFGYPPETPEQDVRPFETSQFVDPQGRGQLITQLTNEGFVTNHLLRLRRADNRQVWVEVTARAEARPGRVRRLNVEALVRDVTDRKRLEHQARDLYHQLLQSEKLAALGQTISGVAHELNNPLASILSWAERLVERPVDPTVRRGLQAILTESERAARIVRNLLTFARKRPTTRSMVNINHVVRETLAMRAYEHRVTNITVIDALASGLPDVFADAYQMQQVLLNLVINAEQAMLAANGRGTLVVRTWLDAEHSLVLVEVNDDGPGIPDEVKARIFDPFFTTKEVGKGTGLGLTVAYAIVQEHNGRIWTESPPQGGASFFVELPTGETALKALGAEPPSFHETEQKNGLALPPSQPRVLVVEDETALAAAVAEALGDAGFEVERAGDGEEALACLRERPSDLIVCDLKMPRI
ncbi:MAG: response regulator, partial [Acidobacteria bacterium]